MANEKLIKCPHCELPMKNGVIGMISQIHGAYFKYEDDEGKTTKIKIKTTSLGRYIDNTYYCSKCDLFIVFK